jgi:hypothetical protein
MNAILFDRQTSMRRALILALGTFPAGRLSPGERAPLVAMLLDLYRNDPDAGIHGAAEWTLRQWQAHEPLEAAHAELARLETRDGGRWYVNGQGQTLAVIDGPLEFRMGSPAGEPDRNPAEIPHRRVIPRRFAIADKEVTVRQYQAFLDRNPHIARLEIDSYSPDPAGPMNGMTWFEAAAYCNWLSEQEGLPRSDWC